MKTIAIIPSYNEEKHIKEVILKTKKYADFILAINDGSQDNTLSKIKETKILCINFKKNRGKGVALRHGINYAVSRDYEAIIFLDADGQHDPKEIPKLLKELNKGYDIVLGRRKKSHSKMPIIRRISNFIASSIVSLIAGQDIRDVQSGYRAIRADKLKNIKLYSKRYDIEAEILIKLLRKKCRISQVIVKTIYADETSTIHPIKDTLSFFRFILKTIKWEYF